MTPLLFTVHRMLGHFAILLVASTGFLVESIDFSHTITLGSVLTAFIVIAISGVFTVRSRIANIWRQEAEGERATRIRLEEELVEAKQSRATFDREQQELRHALKDDLAACKAQIKAMEAKTDLTAALTAIQQMNEQTTEAIVAAMSSTSQLSEERDGRTQALLGEIRDKLPSEPISVHDITPTDR